LFKTATRNAVQHSVYLVVQRRLTTHRSHTTLGPL